MKNDKRISEKILAEATELGAVILILVLNPQTGVNTPLEIDGDTPAPLARIALRLAIEAGRKLAAVHYDEATDMYLLWRINPEGEFRQVRRSELKNSKEVA